MDWIKLAHLLRLPRPSLANGDGVSFIPVETSNIYYPAVSPRLSTGNSIQIISHVFLFAWPPPLLSPIPPMELKRHIEI